MIRSFQGQASSLLRWLMMGASLPLCTRTVHAQASYTATRAGELQFGGSFVVGRSNYLPVDIQASAAPLSDLNRHLKLIGDTAYGSFDMAHHLGVGLEVVHINARNDSSAITSFKASARYSLFRGTAFVPFVQAGFGHGWYSYPQGAGTVGYNLYGFDAGVDYHLSRSFNVRAAYGYESWLGVPLRNPEPQTLRLGVAYRFH